MIDIVRFSFKNGEPDLVYTLDKYHEVGGYKGVLKDMCISIRDIQNKVFDKMSSKEISLLSDWPC